MAEENTTYASSSADSGQPTMAQLYALAGGAGPVNSEHAQQLIDASPDSTPLAVLALGYGGTSGKKKLTDGGGGTITDEMRASFLQKLSGKEDAYIPGQCTPDQIPLNGDGSVTLANGVTTPTMREGNGRVWEAKKALFQDKVAKTFGSPLGGSASGIVYAVGGSEEAQYRAMSIGLGVDLGLASIAGLRSSPNALLIGERSLAANLRTQESGLLVKETADLMLPALTGARSALKPVTNSVGGPKLQTISEMNFAQGSAKYTDAMNDKSFTKIVKSINENGFQNPVIEYVEINGVHYVARGNNRMMAAQTLGRTDELKFQKVEFPVPGTNWNKPQDILDVSGTVRLPKQRK